MCCSCCTLLSSKVCERKKRQEDLKLKVGRSVPLPKKSATTTHVFVDLLDYRKNRILLLVSQVAHYVRVRDRVQRLEGAPGAQRIQFLRYLWQIDAPRAEQKMPTALKTRKRLLAGEKKIR